MTAIEHLKYLRVINYFNFINNHYPNPNLSKEKQKEVNGNIALTYMMTDFIKRYEFEMKKRYTFIVKYDHTVYSFLALRICHAAAAAMRVTINIRILGDLNAEEKEYFKDFPTISYRKAKKEKHCVLITGYHPIFNVENEAALSKDFIEIYHPVARMNPSDIYVAQTFYLDKDSFLWDQYPFEVLWYDFYKLPIGGGVDWYEQGDDEKNEIVDKIYDITDKSIPLVLFILDGSEEDFKLYDLILESSKEGNIHLYMFHDNVGDKLEFTMTNLGRYIDSRNFPQVYNIVSRERAKELFEIVEQDMDRYTVDYGMAKQYNTEALIDMLNGGDILP